MLCRVSPVLLGEGSIDDAFCSLFPLSGKDTTLSIGSPFWLCMKSGMAVCPQLPQWRYTLLHDQQWCQHKILYYSPTMTKKLCSTFSYTASKEAYKTETHHPFQLESIVELNLVNPVLQRCLRKRN